MYTHICIHIHILTSLHLLQGHIKLAGIIHAVFSDFDLHVMGKDLFKIDTIGDCYIVVGWLPGRNSQNTKSTRSTKSKTDFREFKIDTISDVTLSSDGSQVEILKILHLLDQTRVKLIFENFCLL